MIDVGDEGSGFEASRRFGTTGGRAPRSLGSRVVRRALLSTGLPLLLATVVVAGAALWFSSRTTQQVTAARDGLTADVVGALRADQSRLARDRLDDFMDRRLEELVVWSRSPELTAAVAAEYPQADELAGSPPEAVEAIVTGDDVLDASGATSGLLTDLQATQPAFVELIATDVNGFNVGATGPTTDFVQRDEAWWTGAWEGGALLGPLELDESTGTTSFALAVRLDDGTGEPLGVLKAVVDVSAIQALADRSADPQSQTDVVVASADGQILAETASGHDGTRIGTVVSFLEGRDQAYTQVLGSEAETGFLAVDGTVSGYSRLSPTRVVPALGVEVDNPTWVVVVDQPTDAALAPAAGLDGLEGDAQRVGRLAIGAMVLLTALGLALAAGLARRLAGNLTESLGSLRLAANRLAHHELPALLRTPAGADHPGPGTDPIALDGDREVTEVAAAFNTLRATALDLATSQAQDRDREVAGVLVNLGRRNQQLIGRQLRFIDDLERTESNPDTLRNLFALDQMATRMRRNAESLLVLAGEESPRRGTQPRPVDEVVRAATSEVEDFARVVIGSIDKALVEPRTVSDLTHLLAELIENATLFSPPETTVDIRGRSEQDGSYTISIVDHGLGLPLDRLDEANARLSATSSSGTPAGSFMGLYVVGRLAARHEIRARLSALPDGGTTAQVHLPAGCLSSGPEPIAEIRGSRLHVSGPLVGPPPSRAATPPPARRAARPPLEPTRPVRPERQPAEAGTRERDPVSVPAFAGGDDTDEDTQGLPIPPFKSRQSRRGEPDLAVSTGPDDELVDPENRRFQVRRRVRRTPVSHAGPLDVEAGVGADHGLARAVEVRDKLNRFASGVEAAKARRPTPSAANGSPPGGRDGSGDPAAAGTRSEQARDREES